MTLFTPEIPTPRPKQVSQGDPLALRLTWGGIWAEGVVQAFWA